MSHWSRIGWTIAAISLLIILCCGLLAFAISGNPEWRNVPAICLIVSLLSLAGLITGVVIVFAKRYEARVIDDLHSGKNVLAHWTYTPDEWTKYIEKEVGQRNKLAPWIFLTVMIPTVLIVVWAAFKTGAGLILLLPLVLVPLIVWLVLYLPGRTIRRLGRGDVIILPDGVLLHDRWYSWTYLGARLANVSYEAGEPPVIQFQWMQPGAGYRGVMAMKTIDVPVPHGREGDAKKLMETFQV